MIEFTVKRSEWGRNFLFMQDHGDPPKRCCLGFLGNACGVTDSEMHGYFYPFDSRWPKQLVAPRGPSGRFGVTATPIVRSIARVNDDAFMSLDEKERLLEGLFKSIGIQVYFVD